MRTVNDTRTLFLLAGFMNVASTTFVTLTVLGDGASHVDYALPVLIAFIHAIIGTGATLVIFVTMSLMGPKRSSEISHAAFIELIVSNIAFAAFPFAFTKAAIARPRDEASTSLYT